MVVMITRCCNVVCLILDAGVSGRKHGALSTCKFAKINHLVIHVFFEDRPRHARRNDFPLVPIIENFGGSTWCIIIAADSVSYAGVTATHGKSLL